MIIRMAKTTDRDAEPKHYATRYGTKELLTIEKRPSAQSKSSSDRRRCSRHFPRTVVEFPRQLGIPIAVMDSSRGARAERLRLRHITDSLRFD
jgi:hypothetical protein